MSNSRRFYEYMGPLLSVLSEMGGSGRPAEVTGKIAATLGLSDEEQSETIPSGQSRFRNRVYWARFHLARAGLLVNDEAGLWTLTEHGRAAIPMSTEDALKAVQIAKQLGTANSRDIVDGDGELPAPPANLEAAIPLPDHRGGFLQRVREMEPRVFERFCQQLLRRLGFESVEVTGRSGDGGIDGVGLLLVNPLLSMRTLFQCKRYLGSVSSSTVRDFRGAMSGRTNYGIIITTGTFTADAKREAERDGVPPIELVDGDRLIDLCEKHALGLQPRTIYELDSAFFARLEG